MFKKTRIYDSVLYLDFSNIPTEQVNSMVKTAINKALQFSKSSEEYSFANYGIHGAIFGDLAHSIGKTWIASVIPEENLLLVSWPKGFEQMSEADELTKTRVRCYDEITLGYWEMSRKVKFNLPLVQVEEF